MLTKVFACWSGPRSKDLALAVRDWLPQVLQSVKVWVSEVDIGKGERWSVAIAKELRETGFGILCVTPENLTNPWLHFEAGAIAGVVSDSVSRRVTPLLLGVGEIDLSGPLAQFQVTKLEVKNMRQLVGDINGLIEAPLHVEQLNTAFEMWWPRLETFVRALELKLKEDPMPVPAPPSDSDMLADLVSAVRSQSRAFKSLEREIHFQVLYEPSLPVRRSPDIPVSAKALQAALLATAVPPDLAATGDDALKDALKAALFTQAAGTDDEPSEQ